MVTTLEVISVVVSFILGVLSSKSYYGKFKIKLKEIADVIQSTNKTLQDVVKALEDNELTKDELKQIIEDIKKTYDEIQDLV